MNWSRDCGEFGHFSTDLPPGGLGPQRGYDRTSRLPSRLLPEASCYQEDGHAGGVWPSARPFGWRGWLEESVQP